MGWKQPVLSGEESRTVTSWDRKLLDQRDLTFLKLAVALQCISSIIFVTGPLGGAGIGTPGSLLLPLGPCCPRAEPRLSERWRL